MDKNVVTPIRLGWLYGLASFAVVVHLWWRAGQQGPLSGEYIIRLNTPAAVIWDLALLIGFAVSHSFFASDWFKARAMRPEPVERLRYLILVFCASAFVWMYWAPLPAPMLWQTRGVARAALVLIQALGIGGLIWTVRRFDLKAFFGERAERDGFSVEGPYALCRHPSYFFLLLTLCSPTMPLGRALVAATATAYVLVGSRLEETKLARRQGQAYLAYRALTPWIIPTPSSIKAALKR